MIFAKKTQKNRPNWTIFPSLNIHHFTISTISPLAIQRFVVGIAADFPQVGQEGLLATGRVQLSDERSLVLRQGSEVLC